MRRDDGAVKNRGVRIHFAIEADDAAHQMCVRLDVRACPQNRIGNCCAFADNRALPQNRAFAHTRIRADFAIRADHARFFNGRCWVNSGAFANPQTVFDLRHIDVQQTVQFGR